MSPSTQSETPLKRTSSTAQSDLLTQILKHEQEFRGVNWLQDLFDEHGNEKKDFVNSVLQTQQRQADSGQHRPLITSASTIDDAEELEPAGMGPDVTLIPVLGFTAKRYATLKGLRGDAVRENVLQIIADLQEAERRMKAGNDTTETLAKLAAGGILGVGAKFVGVTIAGLWKGLSFSAATAAAGVGLSIAAAAAIAIVIVVLVAFVLVMMKEAREVHLVLNNSDYDLSVYEVYTHNGKENFRPRDDDGQPRIPARQMKAGVGAIYGGFFGQSKRSGALIGAGGVVQIDLLQNGQKYHTSTFLGYCVPLSGWFGGDNGGLVRCNVGNPSAREFYQKQEEYIEGGNLVSGDEAGRVHVRKCVANQSGSESFAITCYDQA